MDEVRRREEQAFKKWISSRKLWWVEYENLSILWMRSFFRIVGDNRLNSLIDFVIQPRNLVNSSILWARVLETWFGNKRLAIPIYSHWVSISGLDIMALISSQIYFFNATSTTIIISFISYLLIWILSSIESWCLKLCWILWKSLLIIFVRELKWINCFYCS